MHILINCVNYAIFCQIELIMLFSQKKYIYYRKDILCYVFTSFHLL